jgi:hypothetical protein
VSGWNASMLSTIIIWPAPLLRSVW